MADTPGTSRSIDDIERDLAATRERLAENIGTLINEIHPKVVVHRTVEDVKTVAQEKAARFSQGARGTAAWLRARFRDEEGWQVTRIAAVAGAFAALATLIGVIRHGRR